MTPQPASKRWNSQGIKPKASNAMRQQAALKRMTPCELQTGKTAEQLRAEMQEQRARVLAKYLGNA